MASAAAVCHSRAPRPGWSAAASSNKGLRVRGQLPNASYEQVVKAMPDRKRLRQRRSPVQLLGGQLARGFNDGERVSAGGGDDALGDHGVDRAADRDLEELVRVRCGQAGEP